MEKKFDLKTAQAQKTKTTASQSTVDTAVEKSLKKMMPTLAEELMRLMAPSLGIQPRTEADHLMERRQMLIEEIANIDQQIEVLQEQGINATSPVLLEQAPVRSIAPRRNQTANAMASNAVAKMRSGLDPKYKPKTSGPDFGDFGGVPADLIMEAGTPEPEYVSPNGAQKLKQFATLAKQQTGDPAALLALQVMAQG